MIREHCLMNTQFININTNGINTKKRQNFLTCYRNFWPIWFGKVGRWDNNVLLWVRSLIKDSYQNDWDSWPCVTCVLIHSICPQHQSGETFHCLLQTKLFGHQGVFSIGNEWTRKFLLRFDCVQNGGSELWVSLWSSVVQPFFDERMQIVLYKIGRSEAFRTNDLNGGHVMDYHPSRGRGCKGKGGKQAGRLRPTRSSLKWN